MPIQANMLTSILCSMIIHSMYAVILQLSFAFIVCYHSYFMQKSAFKDAACCLFIFDILFFNGESLLDR